MKKILTLTLALLLTLAPAAKAEIAREGYPVTAEKLTLTVFTGTETLTPEDLNTMTIFKKAEEATNIHIEWITVPQGTSYTDKKGLMLATDDLPDIFFGQVTASELIKYGGEGSFIPMEDLIAGYAPNLNAILEKRPELIPFITAADGHIYGVPKITEGLWNQVSRVYNINTQWLETLGLTMPSNLSEFKAMLIAMRDGDPNQNGLKDEIPITFSTDAQFSVSAFEYIFGAYGLAVSDSLLDVSEGKVGCSAQDDRFRQAIKYIADLYKEGLIDPDAFVMDQAQWKAKANSNPAIVGVSPNWDYNDNISDPQVLAQYGMMPPLWGDDGTRPCVYSPAMYGYNRGSGVITKACKNPEAAMRWIDYWFDEINSYEASEGPVGERLFYDENGTLLLGNGTETTVGAILPRASVCVNPFAVRALLKEYFVEKHIAYPSTFPKVDFITENVLKYADPDPFNTKLYYTLEEAETISMLETDIKNFINRKSAEWIIGGTIDEEWEAFQNDLMKMGMDQYLAVQQAAYDRMYK